MNSTVVRSRVALYLIAFLTLNLISFSNLTSVANATATNILNEGSNTGWSGGPVAINNSDGNPAPSLMFSKNDTIYKQYSDTGTDFAGTEITFDAKFIDVKDHFMFWWGRAGSGSGETKQLLIGPGTNSGQRLAALGGLSNTGTFNGYYASGSGTLTGTGNAGVTGGVWSTNTWYSIKIVIGQTSSSYYLNNTLIESKATTLPTSG